MSAFLDNVHLLRPWALVLLVPAVLLWGAGRRAGDTTRRWSDVIDPELLKHLVVGGGAGRRVKPLDLLLAGWIVTVIAVAGPTWSRAPSPFADAAPPVMIVLKVAPSMTTPDLAPTRLDRARQKIADLLKAREGAPAGLITYSGSAHLVLPPTPDREVVTGMAGALSPVIMPREGDRLADAVKLAADVLRDGGRGGSIVVVADTVAPGQTEALRAATAGKDPAAWRPPVVVMAMAPPRAVDADAALKDAVSALDARLVVTTINNDDVQSVAARLSGSGSAPATPGEAPRWQEAGFWLTPFIALLVLGWFRRGWVIAT